jgi:hypothetical protein
MSGQSTPRESKSKPWLDIPHVYEEWSFWPGPPDVAYMKVCWHTEFREGPRRVVNQGIAPNVRAARRAIRRALKRARKGSA